MIIKRWNGSSFVKEFPQTKAQLITNASDTESIFDSFDKIKPNYLPNSVFDSLYYFSNATPGNTKVRAVDALKDALNVAYRSSLGYYWVVSTAGNLTSSGTATVETLYTRTCTVTTLGGVLTTADTSELRVGMIVNGSNIPINSVITSIDQNGTNFTIGSTPTGNGSFSLTFAYSIATFITSGEEREVGTTVTTVGLEIGDWFVISKVTGVGSIASPYNITFAVINNTYELMGGAGASTAGYAGLVPGAASGQNLHFLRGDGTWVIPTNTTYSGSTSITLTGTSFERAALTGDVTASGNSNNTTIAADAVTFAKMQNIATSTILGRVTAGTADIEALTPAQVRGIINVADGAQVNVATNIAQGTRTTTTVPVTSSTGTGATLDIATTSLAGVMSSADKTKLDGIATGATANSTDATLLARGNHTGTQTAATISDFATAVAATASVTANTAKVTNASHTGEVTGSSALTITNLAVTYAKIQNISATSRILGRITAGAGSTEELTGSNVRSIIELAAPIFVQTATPTTSVTHSLWYDINP